jgi:beta-phosphoglucomutase-like phosphatase (HAD superfamily)
VDKASAFLFDLDGTLVDSVYMHVLAWHEALQSEDISLSIWRIHRKIGMSGGLFTHQLLRELGHDVGPDIVLRLSQHHAQTCFRRSMPRHFHGLSPRAGGSRQPLPTLQRWGLIQPPT